MRKLTKITLASSLMLGGCLYASHLLNSPEANASENTQMSTRSTKNYPSKSVNFYVTPHNNALTYDTLDFKNVRNEGDHWYLYNHDDSEREQYIVKRIYDTNSTDDVYSIYSPDGTWLGYGKSKDFDQTYTNNSSQKYVEIINNNYRSYSDLGDFSVKQSSIKSGNKYVAKDRIKHSNGNVYQSLYELNKNTNQLVWVGFINDKALKHLPDDFGDFHKVKDGVTFKVTHSNYGIYQDKNFKKKVGTSQELKNKTLKVKGYYDRFSKKERYLSVYDSNDQWVGYLQVSAGDCSDQTLEYFSKAINKTATLNGNIITLNKINGNFSSLALDGKYSKDEYKMTVKSGTKVLIKRAYNVDNYEFKDIFSIYDTNNKWLGYIDAGTLQSNSDYHFDASDFEI